MSEKSSFECGISNLSKQCLVNKLEEGAATALKIESKAKQFNLHFHQYYQYYQHRFLSLEDMIQMIGGVSDQ